MITNSILAPEMRGVMFIGGRRGVGKSYLAATSDDPKCICFIDFEEKGSSIHHQLDFGAYHTALPGIGCYQNVLSIIDNVKSGQFSVVVFDNISHLEDTMKAEVKKNASYYAKEYGLNQSNIVSGRFGGASAAVNKLISYRISAPLHEKGVRLIIGTAHAKPFWGSGGPIPNKWNILGADRWQDLAVLNLILIEGDNPPVPSAIVKKEQLGLISFDRETGKHKIQRRLPYRLPEATFETLKYYLENPADLKNPAKGETVSKEEYAAYSDELTNEQLEMNKMALEIQQEEIKRQEQEEKELFNAQWQQAQAKVKELVKELKLDKLPPPLVLPKIMPQIKDEFPDFTEDDIKEML